MANKIFLKPGKAKPFRQGEPLIFSGAVARIEGSPQVAELVTVVDEHAQLVGVGMFNPHSSYRVRLLSNSAKDADANLTELLRAKLQKASTYRRKLDLPNTKTTAYRLVNSEGDGLSGLTVDVFNDHAVVMSTAYWVEQNRDDICRLLQSDLELTQVHWRQTSGALKQDGWLVTASGTSSDAIPLLVQENGIIYALDLAKGQKTGFYCDQRDNRLLLRKYAKGRSVLDCYCYTGGFALNAAKGGAKSVTAVDSSTTAIALAKENANLNGFLQIVFEAEKAERFLNTAAGFDFIILDPPKLSPSQRHLVQATRHYVKLNQLAMSKLPEKGLLFTFSCSDAMTTPRFLAALQKAAAIAKKRIKVLQVTGAAPDHKILPKARYGNYLTGVLLEVSG